LSPLVTGDSFLRNYDAVDFTDSSHPADVSSFRLDRYEATNGRFRGFVDAWSAGWRPSKGAGKHAHLPGGSGLTTDDGGYEPGWDPAWNAILPNDKAEWDQHLACLGTYSSWTSDPGVNERRPVDCANWYDAYAFCIWTGGFLPSDTEWNYAAAGGNQQRVFPWSSPPASTAIDCSHANYQYESGKYCDSGGTPTTKEVGSTSPDGDGYFGQAELAGNVSEWCMDKDLGGAYPMTCHDCVGLSSGDYRASRGGVAGMDALGVHVAASGFGQPEDAIGRGVRCAREP
jgi:formylglycine-generating enzyme required for sulfatase activity